MSRVWRRPGKGQRQLIAIEEDAIAQVDHAQIDNGRIAVFGDQLQNGNCSLSIQPITAQDFGTWACTLFAKTGSELTGQVEVTEDECGTIILEIFFQLKYRWVIIIYFHACS